MSPYDIRYKAWRDILADVCIGVAASMLVTGLCAALFGRYTLAALLMGVSCGSALAALVMGDRR